MSTTKAALTADSEAARRLFCRAQGLGARVGSAERALESAGYVRTLGGADAYVALWARVEGASRTSIDAAIRSGEMHVVPAVRGCIYLVARGEVPWCLRMADVQSARRRSREQDKAGIEAGEVEALAEIVSEVLAESGPLDTNSLRRALPEGSVRSLGDAGKKVGISSPLPPALRLLEFEGRIERRLDEGRLDSERYSWGVPDEDPFAGTDLPEDPVELHAHFAEVFFRAAGIGTVADFAEWAGIGKRDAAAAAARLDTEVVRIDGRDGEHLALHEVVDSLSSSIGEPSVALLPFEDNLLALHGGPAALAAPRHLDTPVPRWGGGRDSTLREAKHLGFRSVALDGALVGFWEYDPDEERVDVGLLETVEEPAAAALESTRAGLSAFLRDEVGHGRGNSLDTDDRLRRRLAEIRRLAV